MDTMFNGCIFSRHTEGIPCHRMEDIEALHLLIPGHHIPNGVIPYMAHMDLSRGIGKHFKKVILLFSRILCHLKEL